MIPAELDEICSQAAARLKTLDPVRITILHHNDADGLCSGSILRQSLGRAGWQVHSLCLEKPYPQAVRRVFKRAVSGECIFFADFASGMLDVLAELNSKSIPIFILDHHGVSGEPPNNSCLVNCRLAGIDGSIDCSASSVCCNFAISLSPRNRDLSPLAILGAIGDGFLKDGELTGINKKMMGIAAAAGLAGKNSEYWLKIAERKLPACHIVDQLNALGSFGYFEGGPSLALAGLELGWSNEQEQSAEKLRVKFDRALEKNLKTMNLRKEGVLACFRLGPEFSSMGVKTVGLVCEELLRRDDSLSNYYLAGIQELPNEVPNLGDLCMNQVKISLRVGSDRAREVAAGRALSLIEVLSQLSTKIDCFVDAGHTHAAALTVSNSGEEEFFEALSGILNA
jgi:single-stranded-DNA-specific exonuclease